MELTDEQFRKYNADFNEKYVDEVLEHGNGGFRTVTNRKTATRYALERLVADLQPVEKYVAPSQFRVRSLVTYSWIGVNEGDVGTVVDERDGECMVTFDHEPDSRYWLSFHDEIERI